MTKNKRKLHIWISCGLVGGGLLLSQRLLSTNAPQSTYTVENTLQHLTPMVIPTNSYQAAAPRNPISERAVSEALALDAIKGETEDWEAQEMPTQVKAAQQPISHMTVSASNCTAPRQRNYQVRSVGGGQASGTANVISPASSSGKMLAQASPISMPTPKRNKKHNMATAELHNPFSDELPFSDIQRAAPGDAGTSVGGGSGVGVVTPVGDCPWWMMPLFACFIYIRRHKHQVA